MAGDDIVLGIDLGTTFSVAAYVDEGGWPRVIPNAEGEKTTPSVVLVEDGRLQVGAVAQNQAIAKRDQVVQWIKRAMGDADYRFQGLGPIEISAAILAKLKRDAELELGVPLTRAVITCPAYFSAIEVENTTKAGEAAGLVVQEIVREPTAAAVYYGVEHLQEGNRLLVCDLGGGTFDASILALDGGIFRPLATAGDRQLGGHDWTSDLLNLVAERLADELGEDPRAEAATEQTLYDACERAKRAFSQVDQVSIPCAWRGRTTQVTVSRADFEQLTEWRVQQVLDWTEAALRKATPPLAWTDLDQILLVGGATRLRRVAEALQTRSGKVPIQTAEADTMVALGAAILAKGAFRSRRAPPTGGLRRQPVSGLTLVHFARTAARNLGTRVVVQDGSGLAIGNSAIIPYGTDLPTERTREDYQTSVAEQAFFDIPVVEFDDLGPDVIQETWRFACPPGLPRGTRVQVSFRYDKSGRIAVEAVERRDGTRLTGTRVAYEEPDLRASLPQPRRVVFALDVSGSMSEGSKIARAKQAVIDSARELLAGGTGQVQVGVVTFGSRADLLCALTTDADAVARAVAAITAGGTTAMGAGIGLALDLLAREHTIALRQIVLVSDGMPDQAGEALQAGARARDQGVLLCLLGLGHEGVNEEFLRQVSPEVLMVESAAGIGGAIAGFLTQSAPPSGPQAGITWLGR